MLLLWHRVDGDHGRVLWMTQRSILRLLASALQVNVVLRWTTAKDFEASAYGGQGNLNVALVEYESLQLLELG